MNTPDKRANIFMLAVAVVGILLTALTLRTAIRQDDNFRIFTSIIWLVLFGAVLIRNIYFAPWITKK